VLHTALAIGQSLELPLDHVQLLLKDQSADLCGRVLLEWLLHGIFGQKLLGIVQGNTDGLLTVDDALQGSTVFALPLLFQLAE
jgi:hypothetical protein